MELYILETINYQDEDKFTKKENGYYTNSTDPIYLIEHDIADIAKRDFNYVVVKNMIMGKFNEEHKIKSLLVFKYDEEKRHFTETKDLEEYNKIAKIYNYSTPQKVVLNLTKQELEEGQTFANSLKQKLDNKDYAGLKNMIDQKEITTSGKLNSFLDEINSGFSSIAHSINELLDTLNGKPNQ